MNEKQKQRFWELKGKKSLTASQREELVQLEEKALKSGLDLENLEPVSSDSQLTENELAEIVKSAVEDQVFGLREEILDEVKKAGNTEEVEEIVKKYATEIDQEELIEKLGEKFAGNQVSQEGLVDAFKSAISEFKTESKMTHEEKSLDSTPLIEMPYGDSVETLTVAQKQLHNLLCRKHVNQDIPESSLKSAEARGRQRMSRLESKALETQGGPTGTVGTTAGLELSRVNVDLSSQLQERLYAESAVANRLIGSEINMPTNPFKLPVVTSRPEFKLQKEATAGGYTNPADTGTQNVGTANVTLDTFKLVGVSEYSYEVDEDSVLAILPIITNQLASGAAASFEEAIINGDTSVTHMDTAIANAAGALVGPPVVPAVNNANIAQRAVDGMVHYALVTNTAQDVAVGGVLSAAAIGTLRSALGPYGLNPRDLALIVSIEDYNTLLIQDEVMHSEKYGAQGTIQNGVLPQIFGIDIVPSAAMRTTCDATGVDTGAGGKSRCSLIHVPSWVVGVRREFTVEVDQDKIAQVNQVIASFRRDFKPIGSNFPHTVLGTNIG